MQPYAGKHIGNVWMFDTVFNTKCKVDENGLRTSWHEVFCYRPMTVWGMHVNARFGSGYSDPSDTLTARVGHRIMRFDGSGIQPSSVLRDTGINTVTRPSSGIAATYWQFPFDSPITFEAGESWWLLPYSDVASPIQSIDNYRPNGGAIHPWLVENRLDQVYWRESNGGAPFQLRAPAGPGFGFQNVPIDESGVSLWGMPGFNSDSEGYTLGPSGTYAEQHFRHDFACTIDQASFRFWRTSSFSAGTLRLQIMRESSGAVLSTLDVAASDFREGVSNQPTRNYTLPSPITLAAGETYVARFTALNTSLRLKSHFGLLDAPCRDFWPKNGFTGAKDHNGSTLRNYINGNYRRDGSPFWKNLHLSFRRIA